MSLTDHSLTLQLLDQLMAGDQGVLIGVIPLPVHSHGCDWHSLFFKPQQPHHREIREARHLFNLLQTQSYTKN